MKKTLGTFICLLFLINILWALEEGRFMRYPDIYKDKIVFSYENDLWTVNSQGGVATRLTSSPDMEYSAKFSPDGKLIAFTGSYDGATQNVYVMPSDGGEPKRLTYNPGGGRSVAWTPDGQRIVFRSSFETFISRDPNLYFVNKDGSAPERLPIDRGTLCSFSSDGTKMLYCRKGSEEYYWKRYKGGMYPDIWMYDFTANKFTAMTDYVGKNAYPMWIGNEMFFVCDKTNGISNLCVMDLSTKEIKDVTSYSDFDVMMPSTDGQNIVYMHDGYIYVMDAKTKASHKIQVMVPSDRWALRDRYINPKDYIHSMNISDDGKTAVLEARGDVFTLPVEKGGSTNNLSMTPGSREMYPQISPDGKWVAFFSDKSGEYELYMQKTEGGDWIQLTKDLNKTNYHLVWSPDGKKILFGNKEFTIYFLDVASKKLTVVDHSNQLKNDEFYWEISDYNWSPDSKWITYSLVQYNRNSQIFIYNIETAKKYPVTNDFYDNLYPSFDANGKYLYYVSSRNFDVQMDFYEDNHIYSNPQQIMAVELQAGKAPLFNDGENSQVKQQKEGSALKIDTDGLLKRTYPLPVEAGNYFYLKAGNGKVAWSSVPKFTEDEYEEIFRPGNDTKWDLHIFDMANNKEVVLTDKIRDFKLSANQENLIVQKEKDYYTTSLDDAYKSKSIGDKLDLSHMNYLVNNRQEWNQIFSDAWRWYRDFFYDKNMHGHDWKAMGEKYRAYIPYLSSREDLNWVLQQMVGELCVSHTYIGGGDMGETVTQTSPVFPGWLGADLKADKKSGFYRFDKIYGPDEYNLNLKSPLARPDINVKEGDYLLAINGKEIKAPEDYFAYLQISTGQKISLTVNSSPKMEGAKTYEVEPIRNDQNLRYFRWLTDNINKVLKATDGKVGYMHVNAMNSKGIAEFDKFWRAFRYKDGIILDVRRNSGGWTEYFMIDKLERKMTAYNCLTGMVPFRYPGSTSNGKYVAISNEYNGSDGEAFIEDFKANKLGPVVGVPSWGGLVGILNNQKTIDNGSVEQSNNSFYNKEGKWLVENHGADPDVVIDNDPASVMAGKDPQLDKAIEVMLKKISQEPFQFSDRPAYPVK